MSCQVANRVDDSSPDAVSEEHKVKHGSRKEKSVLQSKLTRLAIQIGYAGMASSYTLVLKSVSIVLTCHICFLFINSLLNLSHPKIE